MSGEGDMNKMKKRMSLLLVVIFLVMILPMSVLAKSVSKNSNQTINSLLDKRAELVCLGKYKQVEVVDRKLLELGANELTSQEVEQKFMNYESKSSTEKKSQGNESQMSACVIKPNAKNVKWLSSTTNYTYKGKTYVVQTLTAQPNSKSSNLKLSGNRAISSTYNWKAGAMNAVKAVGSEVVGKIPGANIVLSVYDTVNDFISGISKNTVVSSTKVLYSYSHVTTVTFKYVKVKGQSDSKQSLTYISTKGVTSIGYQYPTFNYSGSSVKPNIIQGSCTLKSTPTGYNSTLNAVKAYRDYQNSKRRACVDSVKVTGIENKSVFKIYPVNPQFTSHIY